MKNFFLIVLGVALAISLALNVNQFYSKESLKRALEQSQADILEYQIGYIVRSEEYLRVLKENLTALENGNRNLRRSLRKQPSVIQTRAFTAMFYPGSDKTTIVATVDFNPGFAFVQSAETFRNTDDQPKNPVDEKAMGVVRKLLNIKGISQVDVYRSSFQIKGTEESRAEWDALEKQILDIFKKTFPDEESAVPSPTS